MISVSGSYVNLLKSTLIFIIHVFISYSNTIQELINIYSTLIPFTCKRNTLTGSFLLPLNSTTNLPQVGIFIAYLDKKFY